MSSKPKNSTMDNSEKEDDEMNGSSASEKDGENNKKDKKMTEKEKNKGKKAVKESEDESEDDDDEEVKPGLLDLPVELSGVRERKKVDRLSLTYNIPHKDKKMEFDEGRGQKLGECPQVELHLQKMKTDDLKPFHKLLFNRPGAPAEIKRNIRKFNGFSFEKSSNEFEKKKANLDRLTIPVLKKMCELLHLEKGSKKEDMIDRILEFLLNPHPSEKKLPSKSKKKTPAKKAKVDKRKQANSNKNEDVKSESESSDQKNISEDEEESEKSANEEEDEEEKPKAPFKNKEKKKPEKKAETKPAAKSKGKRKIVSSDDDDESSDDEPLVKKGKQPPTDDELKALIKSILDGANLEEITMKQVFRQVYAKFPEFDLSSKKEFIKTTVRSIIV